jgi:hypothetical protein
MRLATLLFLCSMGACGGNAAPPREPAVPAASTPAVVEVPQAGAEPTDDAGADPGPDVQAALPERTPADAGAPEERCFREHVKGVPCGDEQPRDTASVVRVIAAARSKFRACYREEQKTRPKLAAKFTLQIVVDPSGAVRSVTESSSPQSDPTLVACVTDAVKKLSFEPASDPTTLNLPLAFVPPTP